MWSSFKKKTLVLKIITEINIMWMCEKEKTHQ